MTANSYEWTQQALSPYLINGTLTPLHCIFRHFFSSSFKQKFHQSIRFHPFNRLPSSFNKLQIFRHFFCSHQNSLTNFTTVYPFNLNKTAPSGMTRHIWNVQILFPRNSRFLFDKQHYANIPTRYWRLVATAGWESQNQIPKIFIKIYNGCRFVFFSRVRFCCGKFVFLYIVFFSFFIFLLNSRPLRFVIVVVAPMSCIYIYIYMLGVWVCVFLFLVIFAVILFARRKKEVHVLRTPTRYGLLSFWNWKQQTCQI